MNLRLFRATILIALCWGLLAIGTVTPTQARLAPQSSDSPFGPLTPMVGLPTSLDESSTAPRVVAHKPTKLDSTLDSLSRADTASLSQLADDAGLQLDGDSVHVTASIDPTQLDAARQTIMAAGGRITKTSLAGDQIQGFVPVGDLQAVASSPTIQFLRRPDYFSSSGSPRVGQLTTEGVAISNASAWHAANQRGTGVKVAVIDVGFEGYQTLLGSDLPVAVTAINFADTGTVTSGGPHGTACAEIVYDMAPGVTIYLMRVASLLDIQEAVNYSIANGIRVISSSIGIYNTSPGDGTGFLPNEVARARNAGIVWVTAASNDRESHWGGLFNDSTNNTYHEFAPGWEINCFSDRPGGDCVSINPGFGIQAFLRWDNWSAPVNQDYDLFILRWNGSSWATVSTGGVDVQNGNQGQTPTEFASAVTSGGATAYGVAIKRYSATRTNVNFELFVPKFLPPRYNVTARSLSNLADAPAAITVAALDVTPPYAQESYSSEGPTNGPGGTLTGGFIKPDISAFANVNTRAYGTTPGEKFNGTSSATPHVAGAAALVRAAFPSANVTDVANFLYGRAIDIGASGRDSAFGYGRLSLGAPPITSRVRFDFNGNGRSDILWRHATGGDNTIWFINGNQAPTSASLTRVPDLNWQIVGSGDFNADGRADILWRHATTGDNVIWFINGGSFSSVGLSRVNDLNWRVVGTGDFNGDRRSDILWRHATTGNNTIWFMNGAATTVTGIPRVNDLNWRIVGTGDFNGDEKADILWRHATTGNNTIWLMNGAAATSASFTRVNDLNWRIAGTGDFNGDRKSDILWRNGSTGANTVWFMNGALVTNSANVVRVTDLNWQVIHNGDFNGDGKADILWRHATNGNNTIWFMNGGFTVSSFSMTRVADTNWRMIGNPNVGTGTNGGPFALPDSVADALANELTLDGPLSDPMAAEETSTPTEIGPALPEADLPGADGVPSAEPATTTMIYLPVLTQ